MGLAAFNKMRREQAEKAKQEPKPAAEEAKPKRTTKPKTDTE